MFIRDRRGLGQFRGWVRRLIRSGTIPVPMGDGVPAVPSSVHPDCPTPSSSLTSSGQSVTPSSQTLAWGDAGDSSVPLSPNRIQAGRSQDVLEEGGIFHVSPVSPGFWTRPSRDAPQFPPEGVLLPSTMDDFSDLDLAAPITYAQCELIPGVGYPKVIASVFCAIWILCSAGPIFDSDCVGYGDLLSSGRGILCRRSSHGYGGRPVAGDGPAGLSVLIYAIQRTAVRGWESGLWLTASSPTVPGVCRCAEVGSPLVPLTNVLG